MPRWLLMGILSFLSVACSTTTKPLEEVLPATADGWTRTQVTPIAPSAAPDLVKQLGVKSAASATYTGPASLSIRIYEMNVATSAFELIQKWRQQDGLAVYKGAYFVVADATAGPQAAALLETIRKQLP